MGDLDRDTAVVGEGGRYTATLSDDWEIWGPNGGYIGAILLRAAGASTDLPVPASLAVHYLARGSFEEVQLQVRTPAPDPPGRGRRGEHDPGRPGHRRGPGLVRRPRPAGPRARRDRHARGRRSGGAADDDRAPAGGRHREPVPLLGQPGEPAVALAGRLAAARPPAAGVRVVVPVPAHRHLRRPAGRRGPARRRPRHHGLAGGHATSTRGSGRPTARRRGWRRASTSTCASTRRRPRASTSSCGWRLRSPPARSSPPRGGPGRRTAGCWPAGPASSCRRRCRRRDRGHGRDTRRTAVGDSRRVRVRSTPGVSRGGPTAAAAHRRRRAPVGDRPAPHPHRRRAGSPSTSSPSGPTRPGGPPPPPTWRRSWPICPHPGPTPSRRPAAAATAPPRRPPHRRRPPPPPRRPRHRSRSRPAIGGRDHVGHQRARAAGRWLPSCRPSPCGAA